MSFLLWIAAVVAFIAVVVLWDLAMVAALRPFGINLPYSFAFHVLTRREQELRAALKGSPADTYVLVSGFLLFACPFLAGIVTYDCFADWYVWHSTYALRSFVGSAVILAVAGVWVGVSDWKKSDSRGIDPAS